MGTDNKGGPLYLKGLTFSEQIGRSRDKVVYRRHVQLRELEQGSLGAASLSFSRCLITQPSKRQVENLQLMRLVCFVEHAGRVLIGHDLTLPAAH